MGWSLLRREFDESAYPGPAAGSLMLIIAALGFVVNTAATLLLKTHACHDLNMKSAYQHLLTDAVESIAVVPVAGIIAWKDRACSIRLNGWHWSVHHIKSVWGIVA